MFALAVIVGMIFLALDKVARDDFLKKIGKIAVGGCACVGSTDRRQGNVLRWRRRWHNRTSVAA